MIRTVTILKRRTVGHKGAVYGCVLLLS